MEKKLFPVSITSTDDQVSETIDRLIMNLAPDMKIISGGDEEIPTTKYSLSLFSPSVR